MAHLVDELLLFERELQISFSDSAPPEYTNPPVLTVLPVLLEDVPFDKWRSIEKSCKEIYSY